MKIAFVAYDLNPTLGSECGTADLWLKALSKYYCVVAFTQLKHKQDVLNENYPNVEFFFIDIPNWILKISEKTGFYPLSNLVFAQKVKKILSTLHDIELIHCITPAGLHSFNSLYQLDIPLIIGPIGGALELPQGFRDKKVFYSFRPRNIYYRAIKHLPTWRNYFNYAKLILIGTEYVRDKLPAQCRKNTKVFFDTAVNPDIFSPRPKKSREVTICYTGRIEYHKGIDLLLEACESLFKNYKNVILVIAGDGAYRKKIPSDNPKIRYVGRLPREKIVSLLNQSDIYCLPTLTEPGGAAILEAMSCGLPVVTTNYGGPAISVTNECGFRIDPLNRKYYIEQLKYSLKRLIDSPELRKKMGMAGRERVQQEFSPRAIENNIIKIYQDIMTKKPKTEYKKINLEQKSSETDTFTPTRYRHFFENFPKGTVDVLDVGCNTGRGGAVLKELNPELNIIGLDCLKERLDRLNPSVYKMAICATTTNIPVLDSSFDVIVAGEFIEHLNYEDVNFTFVEFYRILKESGLLILTTPNPSGIIMKLKGGSVIGGAHLSEHKYNDLKKKLRNFGFSNIKIRGTGRVSTYIGKNMPICFYNSYLLIAKKTSFPE